MGQGRGVNKGRGWARLGVLERPRWGVGLRSRRAEGVGTGRRGRGCEGEGGLWHVVGRRTGLL